MHGASIQCHCFGSRAAMNASRAIHDVTASVPTIRSSGWGAIISMNRKASNDAMRSTLLQVNVFAERGCWARLVQ
jgi:hypothetical protein